MPTAKRKPTPKAKKRNILSYLWILVIVAGLGWLGYTTFLKPSKKVVEEPTVALVQQEQEQVQQEYDPSIQQVQQESPVIIKKSPVKQLPPAVAGLPPKKSAIEEAKEISDLVSAILEKLVGLSMAFMGAIMMYFNIKAKQLEVQKEEEEEKSK